MPHRPLPCCADGTAQHKRDLGHLYHFDFDLYRCSKCNAPHVWAFSSYGADWEKVTDEDAAKLESLPEEELRPFMRVWAREFN